MNLQPFRFKKFEVEQVGAAHAVGTDGVLLGAWTTVKATDRRVLDIGTGTGLMALMLTQRFGNQSVEQIFGLENHAPSAHLAARNFEKSCWSERLVLIENSIQNFCESEVEPFDLMVCNPPFFTEKTASPDPARRAARHSQSMPPADLIFAVKKLLAPQGRFCTVLPRNFGYQFCEQAAVQGLYFSKIVEICTRPGKSAERLLLEFRNSSAFFGRENVLLADENGLPSAWFQRLTADFLLSHYYPAGNPVK